MVKLIVQRKKTLETNTKKVLNKIAWNVHECPHIILGTNMKGWESK